MVWIELLKSIVAPAPRLGFVSSICIDIYNPCRLVFTAPCNRNLGRFFLLQYLFDELSLLIGLALPCNRISVLSNGALGQFLLSHI